MKAEDNQKIKEFTEAVWAVSQPADLGKVFGIAIQASPLAREACRNIWETWCGFITTPDNCIRPWPTSIK